MSILKNPIKRNLNFKQLTDKDGDHRLTVVCLQSGLVVWTRFFKAGTVDATKTLHTAWEMLRRGFTPSEVDSEIKIKEMI